jgi:hypothetical protein
MRPAGLAALQLDSNHCIDLVAMLFSVVLVYNKGRKLSEAELRSAPGVVGDVRTHTVLINGKEVHQAVCMGGSKESLPPLFEPQFTE